jgi:2,3-bisphosphoglycerate-independent phosphoglycerate mutase
VLAEPDSLPPLPAPSSPEAEKELEASRERHLTQVRAQFASLGYLVELQYRCGASPTQKHRLQAVLSSQERRLVQSFGVELRAEYRQALVRGAQSMAQRLDAASPERRAAACEAFMSSLDSQLDAMQAREQRQPEILP